MAEVRVEPGDCLEVLPRLAAEGVRVDAIVTDPPYHLTSTVERFGKPGSAPARPGKTGAYARASTGFMGKQWDGGGVAFDPATWRAAGALLKPGGYLLAFGGDRTYDMLGAAIRAAGFEVRGAVLWLYGSGFPKSRAMPHCCRVETRAEYEGWGTALKPAVELICMARKPLAERSVAANVLEHGTGALNIDGCRVDAPDGNGEWPITDRRHDDKTYTLQPVKTDQSLGRWPANVTHDGSPEVLDAFAAFGEQGGGFGRRGGGGSIYTEDASFRGDMRDVGYGDSGTAARFFYSAKADADDRFGSRHPTVKPVDLMRWLVRLVTPPGGLVLDPFAGSGTTGAACLAEGFDALLIEREPEYLEDIAARLDHARGDGGHSAAVKARRRKPEETAADKLPLFKREGAE